MSYRLKHAQGKLASLKKHLTFLMDCQKNYIILKSLRLAVPVVSPQARFIAWSDS